MRKKIFLGFVFVILMVATFFISYYISFDNFTKYNTLPKSRNNTAQVSTGRTVTSTLSSNDYVNKDTKIIFEIEYKKSGDIVQETKTVNAGDLIGKTKKDLEALYVNDGYVVSNMNSKQVVLLKSFDRYSPKKYVLDIYKEGDCLAIFKTDDTGKETIENPDMDIKFDSKLSEIKEGDLDTLMKGSKSLQFDSRDDAEDSYNAMFKS